MTAHSASGVRARGAVSDATSGARRAGPQLVLDRLAAALVARCPIELDRGRVLDLGARAGAVAALVGATGARPVAVDGRAGIARTTGPVGVPSVEADSSAMPFAPRAFDAVIAPFALNHLPQPLETLREARRVLQPGGVLLASTYGVEAEPRHVAELATAAGFVDIRASVVPVRVHTATPVILAELVSGLNVDVVFLTARVGQWR